jgi:hypothetical protein
VVTGNVSLHVGAARVNVIHSIDISINRISQLIGSTLALEYMRAGKLVVFSYHIPAKYLLQNTSLLSVHLLSSSTFSLLASSSVPPSQVLTYT